jgi:hypothetical protein
MSTEPATPESDRDPPPPVASGEFAQLHAKWVSCLDAEHRNSIMQQLYEQTWRHAVYRIILLARQKEPLDANEGPGACKAVQSLIDQCFLESALAAIRRQLDLDPIEGSRGVHSLTSLVRDMRSRQALFTRRNLFAIAGLPLDPTPRRARFRNWLRSLGKSTASCFAPPEMDADPIESLHEDMDRLTQTTPQTRSPSDVVPDTFFEAVLARLNSLGRLRTVATKFLAHSATVESIQAVKDLHLRATLKDIQNAHETMCRVAQLVDRYLLRQTSHAFLPLAAGDPLRNLDSPLACTRDMPDLRAEWQAYASETEVWGRTGIDWLTWIRPTSTA